MNKIIFSILIVLVGYTANINCCISLKMLDKFDCHYYIKQLANYDKCLSSRSDLKHAEANIAKDPEEFFKLVTSSKCNGTAYACGLTMSWVTELFEGLRSQYNMSKYDDGINGAQAGYSLVIGDDLRKLFDDNKNKLYPIVYHMRHTGTEDHVWTIEQLPMGSGYRIYQSYHDAYSLKAWLSTSLDGLYDAEHGDIMLFNELKSRVNEFIKQFSGGKYNISSDLDNAPELPAFFIPFCKYVKNYNQTTATDNLKRAWNKYGKGQVVSWETMKNYIDIVANMTTYFKQNDNTQNLFNEKIFNDWIDLFGSPNPVHYPNLPHNGITSLILPGRSYRFEVKKVAFDGYTSPVDCYYNYYNIRLSV